MPNAAQYIGPEKNWSLQKQSRFLQLLDEGNSPEIISHKLGILLTTATRGYDRMKPSMHVEGPVLISRNIS